MINDYFCSREARGNHQKSSNVNQEKEKMQRSRSTSLAVAAAASLGALITLTAPIAHAEKIPEKTIKSECASAGGTYTTVSKGGTRFSTCDYKDNEGNKFRDYYADGGYYSTRPA